MKVLLECWPNSRWSKTSQRGLEEQYTKNCPLVSDLSCTEADICHLYATCTYEEHSKRDICVCDEGYHGDGTMCHKTGNPLPIQLFSTNNLAIRERFLHVWRIPNHLFFVDSVFSITQHKGLLK